jgi:glycosyltransferase involved in cell wall biosynthesis
MTVPPTAPRAGPWISVIIPALNEEGTIAQVVAAVPREFAHEIIVVDNGSDDDTMNRALGAGARVVRQPQRGYGRACRAGVEAVDPRCTIVAFLDGDGSDCPELIGRLVQPILAGHCDFVVGSRLRGRREPGSMEVAQVIAGHGAGFLIHALYGVRYTDMCPFRAIRRESLERLGVRAETYGWNLEMQMRAAIAGLRILEVPVDHRRRKGGSSKVSGTVRGTVLAGIGVLTTFASVAFERTGRAQGTRLSDSRGK